MANDTTSPIEKLIALEIDAREFGFDWPDHAMILEQVISECDEIADSLAKKEAEYRVQEEIGDLLHTAISLCIFSGFDVNDTITKVTKKFSSRMDALKIAAKQRGLNNLKNQSIELMLELWKEAKKQQVY